MSRGHWILIQNCHLLIRWLFTLIKLLESQVANAHKNFRLWLTTEPDEKFPGQLLENSIKVVTEPPNSLCMNMLSTYQKLPIEILEQNQHKIFKPLVFVLSYFHAILCERKKYGKIGWNLPYEFNESDYFVSIDILNIYMQKIIDFQNSNQGSKTLEFPWNTIR